MTMEEYKIALDKWRIDIAEWQKAERAWAMSLMPGQKRLPKPGPAPKPPVPPNLTPLKPPANVKPNVPPSGNPRPI